MGDTPAHVQGMMDAVKKYGFESLGVYYGNYRGTVVSNKDPQKLGRVQIRVPQIMGDNKGEYWAWPKGQPAGDDFGDFFIPPPGSPVWVEFENGDPSRPIWSGGHWAKSNGAVPEEGKKADPKNRVRKTEEWIFEMDDEEKKLRVSRKNHADDYIEIDQDGNVKVGGRGKVTIDGKDGVEFKVNGVTKISMTPSGSTIDGKEFLNHQHTGVDTGGGTSGGVA